MKALRSMLSSLRFRKSGGIALAVWLAASACLSGPPTTHAGPAHLGLTVSPDISPEKLESMRILTDPLSAWQTYKRLREEYTRIERECEELREAIARARAEIRLHSENLRELAAFVEGRRRAWERIYAPPGNGRGNARPERERPPPVSLDSLPEAEERGKTPSLRERVSLVRQAKRHLEKLREDIARIEATRESLEREFDAIQAELEIVRDESADVRTWLEEDRRAWRRLYRE